MKKRIEIREKCPDCKGTGLYVGMAERDGAAIVCHSCCGSGCHIFIRDYEDFIQREERPGVKRVYQANPGIGLGEGNGFRLEDFGGISFDDWKAGKTFASGTENRRFTCPAWWYQSADYKKKPDWKECWESLGRSFSHCPSFATKASCWERWDKQYANR